MHLRHFPVGAEAGEAAGGRVSAEAPLGRCPGGFYWGFRPLLKGNTPVSVSTPGSTLG